MLRMEERTCFKEDEDAWATTGMISGVVVTSSRNFHRNTRNFRGSRNFRRNDFRRGRNFRRNDFGRGRDFRRNDFGRGRDFGHNF